MNRRNAVVVFFGMLVVLAASWCQRSALGQSESSREKPDKAREWRIVESLVGTWKGTGTGSSGKSRIDRSYDFILNDQFIVSKTRSVTKPQEKNPKGEIHEDWEIFSYDRGRNKLVMRQFLCEGYITQYVLDEVSDDGNRLVFVSEQVENLPPGFRARITWTLEPPNAIREVLELGPPGQDFFVCVETSMKRRK